MNKTKIELNYSAIHSIKEENKMQKTNIEWVLNPDGTQGYSWNPLTGCLNGCDYCYARKLAFTRLRERYLANKNTGYDGGAIAHDRWLIETDPFYPRFWPDKLDQPLKRKKPAGIFTCDMSDLFGIGVPEQWTWSVFNFIKECPQHRFYLLTKQPQNLIKFSPYPPNCWVGVSAWDESSLVEAYNSLIRIEARTKYISLEPFLGWGRLYEKHACKLSFLLGNRYDYPNNGIDWIIIGACTPYSQKTAPKIEWVREIVEAADKAGVEVFLKDSLLPLVNVPDDLGSNYHLMYYDDEVGYHKLRQEFPKKGE